MESRPVGPDTWLALAPQGSARLRPGLSSLAALRRRCRVECSRIAAKTVRESFALQILPRCDLRQSVLQAGPRSRGLESRPSCPVGTGVPPARPVPLARSSCLSGGAGVPLARPVPMARSSILSGAYWCATGLGRWRWPVRPSCPAGTGVPLARPVPLARSSFLSGGYWCATGSAGGDGPFVLPVRRVLVCHWARPVPLARSSFLSGGYWCATGLGRCRWPVRPSRPASPLRMA
jgi:hypothetical protein